MEPDVPAHIRNLSKLLKLSKKAVKLALLNYVLMATIFSFSLTNLFNVVVADMKALATSATMHIISSCELTLEGISLKKLHRAIRRGGQLDPSPPLLTPFIRLT